MTLVDTPPAQVTLGDLVYLHFKGWPDPDHPKFGQPLILSWNNRVVTLNPGDRKSIPFELAKNYFGDPRSLASVIRLKDEYGNDMIVADRRAEVIRLQGLWQSRKPSFREYIPGDRSFIKDGISDMLPDIEITDLDGNHIFMVTDDPYGDNVMAATTTIIEQEQLKARLLDQHELIKRLEAQNRLLFDKLGLDPNADLAAPLTAPLTQDPSLTTPTSAVLEESPKMVYNPRTKRTQPKRFLPTTDPTTIEDLEPDND
jgi:hypothetical protein